LFRPLGPSEVWPCNYQPHQTYLSKNSKRSKGQSWEL
jgi:hypothetical protein